MKPRRSVQFAITREDPEIEAALIETFACASVLLICSAGDTILALKEKFPALKVTAFDFNPAQIEHFKIKARGPFRMELTQAGNFEGLFRIWASVISEFIIDDPAALFRSDGKFPEDILSSPYWPVSFDLAFHDRFLETMFGPAAIQHAPKGSYPRYFQNAFERGLRKSGYQINPFLQHIFLNQFLDVPSYLTAIPETSDVNLLTGGIDSVRDLSAFDLVQLSNIFDWSSESEIRTTCRRLSDEMKKDSIVLLRQINNDVPMEEFLGPKFSCDHELGKKLVERDRSLFYSRITVARKLS